MVKATEDQLDVNGDPLEVTEQEKQDNVRFNELKKKAEKDLTEEEKSEKNDLRDRYQDRTQKRFDILRSRELSAKNEAEQLREQLAEEKRLREEGESKRPPERPLLGNTVRQTVQFDGKSFYTDEALYSLVEGKEITEAQAIKHQQERLQSSAVQEALTRIKGEGAEAEARRLFSEDLAKVYAERPEFDAKHPKHNPEDPLFKKANEILREMLPTRDSWKTNPTAMGKALKLAKQVLRIEEKRPDLSSEFNADLGRRAGENEDKRNGKPLTEIEEENAFHIYRNVVNPKTNRLYTKPESIEKYKKAQERRTSVVGRR